MTISMVFHYFLYKSDKNFHRKKITLFEKNNFLKQKAMNNPTLSFYKAHSDLPKMYFHPDVSISKKDFHGNF